jgi:hypothetical protein
MNPSPFAPRLVLAVCLASVLTSAGCMMYSPRRGHYRGASAGEPSAPAGDITAQWSTYRVADSIEVALPGAPGWRREEGRADDGAALDTTVAESQLAFPRMAFQIFVTKFEGGISGDLTEKLEMFVDAFIDDAEDMEVRDARSVTTQGFPGVELELVNAETHVITRTRHYVGRQRVYVVVAHYQHASFEATVSRFFERLAFAPGDAPVPAGDARLDTNAWASIFPPADDFAIDMPGSAQARTEPFSLGSDTAESNVFRVGAQGAARFSVHVTPIGDMAVEGLLARLRDQRLGQGYRLREARDTQRQGYAGLAVVHESDTEVVYGVFVLTLSRIYEARVTVPRAEEAAIAPHRSRFFQSLRIL